MLAWLFPRSLDRERAVEVATRFLNANGYRVVTESDGDPGGDPIPVVFEGADLPGKRWYVRFRRLPIPGLWRSHDTVFVRVHSETGLAEFDTLDPPEV